MRNSLDIHHEQTPQELKGITKATERGEVNISISTPPECRAENREAELQKIAELRDFIDNSPETESSTHNLPKEVVLIDGKEYNVIYVPREEIYPLFGYASDNCAVVRDDLSPTIRGFVKAHELYHCRDTASWGGWIGSEIRANVVPGIKDPIGLFATIWATISDKDRIKFYIDRFKRSY